MGKAYAPTEIENKWYQYWEKNHLFHAEPDERPPYCIVIPPPNITGALHLGHALNNCIQDVLVRFYRMRQYNACWVPGTDHAGIATQSVIEKRLYREEGKTRHDIGREALLDRIWKWKDTYGNRIIDQLKKLGCSCDWQRTCFTMDRNLSHAVRVVFLQLFQEGLIYRGKRLINWCPGCCTALSNDELKYRDKKAHLWEINYPVKDSDRTVTVATTRPETMLGDTAVAVHSQDKRYQELIGQKCILPLLQREIPIIADDLLADPKKGTGAVKVTPGHDPNDYACGLRNQLPMINILNEDATLNENAGPYCGLTVAAARERVLQDLQAQGLLGETQDIEHAVAHCYRSDDVVEPFLSDQWFVKMQPLVELARQAVVEERVTFFPGKRAEDYLRWLDQTPDWCISRQIWWGHRIPIWYCRDCHSDIEVNKNGEPKLIPGNARPILPQSDAVDANPEKCPQCGKDNLLQDPDVLDTWFSSQLWPLSTLGWPEATKELQYYYPTSVLVTARDIIALWVARMVMMGMKFRQLQPFSHVFIHGTIQDEHGDIMSKSRGNGFDPVRVIEGGTDHIDAVAPIDDIPAQRTEHYPIYGCDALRYGIMSMTSGQGQDIRIAVQRNIRPDQSYDVKIPLFEEGRRFCNKIWNACHGVIFANCRQVQIATNPSPYLEDRWLADRLHQVIIQATAALENYRIGEVCNLLYHFFWDDLCAWYLENAKSRLWGEQGEASRQHSQTILLKALDTFLRLLHPVMPFISEELWQELSKLMPDQEKPASACIVASWPQAHHYQSDAAATKIVELARDIASAINNIRAESKLAPGKKVPQVILTGENAVLLAALEPMHSGIKKLCKIEAIHSEANVAKPEQTAMRMVKEVVIYVPLTGLIDFAKEKERLDKEIANLDQQISRLESKLANPSYTGKAPAHLVERDRERLAEYQKQRRQFAEEWERL